MLQLLIKNGTVVDPANSTFGVRDIAVKNGCVDGVGNYDNVEAQIVIDARDCIVTPGLIDHHVHLHPLAGIGIPAEAVCFSSGVTTVVDAGSTGCANYKEHRTFLKNSKLGVKAYLHVCSLGLSTLPAQMEDVSPCNFDVGAIREIFEAYGDDLLGLKLRTSQEVVRELGYTPLKKTIELADKLGTQVMVHCTNPPGKMTDLLQYLRRGDVLTHFYMNRGDTILNEQGRIHKEVYAARERGVLFETADARTHFSFAVSEAAIKDGFAPDIIATDLTRSNMYLRPTVFHLANLIAKYCYLGLPLDQVISCCTEKPAQQMGQLGNVGCLSRGAKADIAVFEKIACDVEFGDRPYSEPEGELRHGDFCFRPVLTVKNGEIVYRDVAF